MDRLSADRMFAQVVRQGSFSAAAAQLGQSPGQASKLVTWLEGHLGVRLLNRTTRANTLTAEGEAYFGRISTILDQLDDLDDSLREAGQNPRGQLRLTAPLTFGTAQLMPALADFSRRHPGIGLEVRFTDSMMGLAEHGFDVAIRVGQPIDSSLKARKLGTMRIQVVAARQYLEERGFPNHPNELGGHDIITDLNFARPDEWHFRDANKSIRLGLPGRLRFNNAEACIIAAKAGLGITRSPDFISGPALHDKRLVELLANYREGESGVYALTPAGRHMPSRLRLLLDFLRHRWGPDHDWSF